MLQDCIIFTVRIFKRRPHNIYLAEVDFKKKGNVSEISQCTLGDYIFFFFYCDFLTVIFTVIFIETEAYCSTLCNLQDKLAKLCDG